MLRLFGRSTELFNTIKNTPKYVIGCVRFAGGSYDHDGKTKISIMNRDPMFGLMINSYSELGFRLNNGVKVIGPMAIFSRTLLAWNVACADDINEESLSLFYVHHPRLDLLVMGIGDEGPSPELRQRIFNLTRTRRINVEILPTYQACATFNFLSADNRVVAGALIPPRIVAASDADFMQTNVRNIQDKLYPTSTKKYLDDE